MFFSLFRRRPLQQSANALYLALVAQARQPIFYLSFGVPDTLDGRFDMIALHAFLLLHRLKEAQGREFGSLPADLSQEVFDLMFADMDRNLREMGVGDLGIAPKVKAMARAFYGRVAAYEAGLDASELSVLLDALKRNLYRGVNPAGIHVQAMAAYVRHQAAFLKDQRTEELLAGTVLFSAP